MSWLDYYRRKVAKGLLGDKDTPVEVVISKTIYPNDWPDSFVTISRQLGLKRYLDELLAIERGEMKTTPFHERAMLLWSNRGASDESLVLFGGEGTGKSVTALRIALRASQNGMTFEFVDSGEFADFWARQDHDRIKYLKTTGLLIIDELGDCEDIKGPAFGLLKRVINSRYRNALPTVLTTTKSLDELVRIIGPEIIDRFAYRLGTKDGSKRRVIK